MNSFLDTVQPIQFANENFRKQLMGAGIESDPIPATRFDSQQLLNVAITFSQTVNYVQLRHLTQMLDVAEHVTSQEQIRAMSNSFLSDMLSPSVKKTSPLQPMNTCNMVTQTQPAVWTLLQLQQQQLFR
ncbi:hypothetical protein BGX21_002458 [Mortierella sp. AD011]|nr:hypothetical protein BGX20_005160 [Mortierella sp. AD010]KAF9380126.1 hypothetical protein BGX21_002458 [Mortierella sp. AD011]